MKYLIFNLILYFLISLPLYSADYEPIDMANIKHEIESENSPFFYPAIFERYVNNDTTLTIDDYKYLYYGHAMQPYYNPAISITDDSAKTLRKYLNNSNSDFRRIAELATFLLRLNPVSLEALYVLGIAYDVLENKEKSAIYSNKYLKFIQVILNSGDGKSKATGYKTLQLADEYIMIKALNLKFKEHRSHENCYTNYDVMLVEKSADNLLDSIYFDNTLFHNFGDNQKVNK